MNNDDNMDIDNNVAMDPDMDLDCSVSLTTHYIHAHVPVLSEGHPCCHHHS